MKFLFEIDRTIEGLGEEEVKALIGKGRSIEKRFLVVEGRINKRDIERFGLVRAVYEVILNCQESNLLSLIKKIEWQKYYNRDFAVRKHPKNKPSLNEKRIADEIWSALKTQGIRPRTNLRNPTTELRVIKLRDEVFLSKMIWKRANFEERRPDRRPALHPSSMHPKIARALINISGIKSGYLIDPFCGSGGILIEAALLGYRVKGIDIDGAMLRRAKRNIDYFGLKVELEKNDATKLNEQCDLIVTDPPYGKNTKTPKDIKELYLDFLKNAKTKCKSIVMMFPSFVDVEEITKKAGVKIEKSWRQYLHKSLSRIICRISPS